MRAPGGECFALSLPLQGVSQVIVDSVWGHYTRPRGHLRCQKSVTGEIHSLQAAGPPALSAALLDLSLEKINNWKSGETQIRLTFTSVVSFNKLQLFDMTSSSMVCIHCCTYLFCFVLFCFILFCWLCRSWCAATYFIVFCFRGSRFSRLRVALL